jgi:hypothetical protein
MYAKLLPTPTSRDHKGRNQRDDDTCLPGALASISSSAVSPASPSATPVSVKLNLMIGGCGPKWQESFAK